MKAPEFTVQLAPDEPSISSEEAQAELTALTATMRRHDPRLASLETVRKSADRVSRLMGEWVASSAVAGPALVGMISALGGWLAARTGRKVSLKIGDVEASASSVDEVESLLKLAEKYRAPPSE